MVTQAKFLTVWARSTYLVWYVNEDKSMECCNGENLIKVQNSRPGACLIDAWIHGKGSLEISKVIVPRTGTGAPG